MGTNQSWNWRLAVFKIIKMVVVRPPMINFKIMVRADCVVPACSPLPSPTEALAHRLSMGQRGEVSLWTGVHAPLVSSVQNRANFPFPQPCLFIGFWAGISWTPFSVTKSYHPPLAPQIFVFLLHKIFLSWLTLVLDSMIKKKCLDIKISDCRNKNQITMERFLLMGNARHQGQIHDATF